MEIAPKCPGCQKTDVEFKFVSIHREPEGKLLIVYCGQCGHIVGSAYQPTPEEEHRMEELAECG